MPSQYQGVKFRSTGDPVLFLSNPEGVDAGTRRRILDDLARLNQMRLEETGDPEITHYKNAFEAVVPVAQLRDDLIGRFAAYRRRPAPPAERRNGVYPV